MSPEKYDAWYGNARGSWIGKTEYDLLDGLLQVRSGESMLDVGCGTGYFTRTFSAPHEDWVVGVDRNEAALRYAMQHRRDTQSFVIADAHRLPFADRSFDLVVSVTALCFMSKERTALVEMLRVARRRVVLGLLNRHSLLYLERGRHGGRGGYRDARWHTLAEARALFDGLPASAVIVRSAVFIPCGNRLARWVEHALAQRRPNFGSFIAVAADRT